MKNEREEALKKKEGVFDIKLIFRLDRASQKLENLYFLQNCQNLMYLDVSGNGLKSIRELNKLINLISLDISKNRINSLAGTAY
jgi:Leucine-rich repeat (LRR) protein